MNLMGQKEVVTGLSVPGAVRPYVAYSGSEGGVTLARFLRYGGGNGGLQPRPVRER